MRILHLIDEASPQATGTTLALLAESLGRLGHIDQHVLLLGSPKLSHKALLSGLSEADDTVDRIGVPFGRALCGTAAVRGWLRKRGSTIDAVHCWSIGALTLACLLRRSVPKLLTVTVDLSDGEVRWLRVLASEAVGRLDLLAMSQTLRRRLLSGGVPESMVHVLRPGIDMGQVVFTQRDAIRRRWGVKSTDVIVAPLSDPVVAADAMPLAQCAYLADGSSMTNGRRVCLLTHPLQRYRRRAEAIVMDLKRPYITIREPWLEHPWLVFAGCDLALAQGRWTGGLSLLWAMSANVPIIGEATYAVSEVLEDRHSALLTQPESPQPVVRRIGQLLHDQQLAWKLRDTARHEAYSFFSRRHYCQSLIAAYEQIVNDHPIELPPMAESGGLRFTGRP